MTETPVQPLEISKEEVAYYRAEIQSSLKRQKDEFIQRIGYEELVRYFEGLQMAQGGNLNEMAILDEISPGVTSVINSTYYQDPDVAVKATRPQSDEYVQPPLIYLIQHPEFKPFLLSDLMKESIRHAMKKAGMKNEMQLADFDLLVAGFTVVEANHAVTTGGPSLQDGTPVEPEAQNPVLGALIGGVKAIGRALTGKEVEEKIASEAPKERIDRTDATYTKRWNPLEVLFDSRATVFEESRHITKIVKMSVADFNSKYPKFKDRISEGSENLGEMTFQAHKSWENKKAVTLYEVEIKKLSGRNCVLVLASGIPDAIDYYEKPFITNGFSMKYQSVDKYGKIYPMSRVKKAKKPQDDMNHYMTVQYEHVDRAQRKVAYFEGGLTDAGKRAMASTDVYSLVEKNSPNSVFEAMPAPSVVPENKEIVMLMRDAINKHLGTTELQKSAKSENELLGQDELQHQAFQTNSGAVVDALADLANQILDTLKDIIMQLWDSEEYFKVTGISGAEFWYSPEMGPLSDLLVGDYSIETDITTAQRPNPVKDRQDALELAKFVTSPDIQNYVTLRGKKTNMQPIENVIKKYGHNPELIFEDLETEDLNPLGVTGPQEVTPVPGQVPGQEQGEESADILA